MGTDSLRADSRFDFLSLFNSRDGDEDDAVPDSFFINDQCSPYSNVTITVPANKTGRSVSKIGK